MRKFLSSFAKTLPSLQISCFSLVEGATSIFLQQPDLRARLYYMFRVISNSQKHIREASLKQILSELSVTVQGGQDVMYVRYIMENLAFHPFEHPEGLKQSISDLERMITVPETVIFTICLVAQSLCSGLLKSISLCNLTSTTLTPINQLCIHELVALD